MIRQDWSTLKKLMFMKTAVGGGAAVEQTATGNPLTFLTDLSKPLKSLLIPFTPIQSGTGDPSPSNIRSILPWNGLTVWHGGADTSEYTETDISFPSPVYGGTLDVVSGVLMVTMIARTYNGTEEGWSNQSANVTTRAIVWDAVRGAKIGDNRIIACNCLKPSNSNQDEAPLNGILNTTQIRNIRLRVSQDDISYEDFRAFLRNNPVTVVCPLVTPQEVQLTPAQITALVGDNTIWSDADGEMAATYLKKG